MAIAVRVCLPVPLCVWQAACETVEGGGLFIQFSGERRMRQLPSRSCVPMGALPTDPSGAARAAAGCQQALPWS